METAVQPDELRVVFAGNIRARRKELGLTQTQVADIIGSKQPNVAAIERGENAPTLDTIAKFAAALRTTPSALLQADIFSVAAIDG